MDRPNIETCRSSENHTSPVHLWVKSVCLGVCHGCCTRLEVGNNPKPCFENAITRNPDLGAFSIAAPRLLRWAISLAQTGASTRLYEVLNRIVQDAVASMARRMSIRMWRKIVGQRLTALVTSCLSQAWRGPFLVRWGVNHKVTGYYRSNGTAYAGLGGNTVCRQPCEGCPFCSRDFVVLLVATRKAFSNSSWTLSVHWRNRTRVSSAEINAFYRLQLRVASAVLL